MDDEDWDDDDDEDDDDDGVADVLVEDAEEVAADEADEDAEEAADAAEEAADAAADAAWLTAWVTICVVTCVTGHGVANIWFIHNCIVPDWASAYVKLLIWFRISIVTAWLGSGNETTYVLLSQGSIYVWVTIWASAFE